MKKLSKDSLIKQFKILVDTREQLPYKFPKKQMETIGLPYGDYTIEYDGKSYLDQIVVERKSRVGELFSASGSSRDRFERELEKMRDVKYKWIMCEFDFMEMTNNPPPGLLEISVVYGSIASWQIKYNIPFIFTGNRQNTRNLLWKYFYNFTKYEILKLK